MNSRCFNEEDFNGYLEQLIESGRLNFMQAGITKVVIDKGYDVLSLKQREIFDKSINTNSVESCERCGCGIPWGEMLEALDNGGYCNYCQYMMEKMKDE